MWRKCARTVTRDYMAHEIVCLKAKPHVGYFRLFPIQHGRVRVPELWQVAQHSVDICSIDPIVDSIWYCFVPQLLHAKNILWRFHAKRILMRDTHHTYHGLYSAILGTSYHFRRATSREWQVFSNMTDLAMLRGGAWLTATALNALARYFISSLSESESRLTQWVADLQSWTESERQYMKGKRGCWI